MDLLWLLLIPVVWLIENWRPIAIGGAIGVFALFVQGLLATNSSAKETESERIRQELDDLNSEILQIKYRLEDVEEKLDS